MRLAFRHLTVDQLHVLSLTFTEVVTTYLTFRFEFGYLAWNFKRFSTTRQQSFDLGICPIRQVIVSLSLSRSVIRFLWFPFPTKELALPCGFVTFVMEELDNRPYWGYFVSHLKDSMGVGSLYTPEVFRHHCFITDKLDKTYN
jgi:hypothetical protein